MAEHKACADVVAMAANTDSAASNEKNGEFKPMCHLNIKPNTTVVDDSGTESGEELNQKILVQVQGALANLESALPALDPIRRSSVVELLTKLQTSLKLPAENKPTPPPRKCWNKRQARQDRHTVGVSSEELQDARRWLEENGFVDNTVPAEKKAASPVSARCTPRSYDVSAPKAFRPVKFVPPPPKRNNFSEEYIPEPSKQSLQNNSFTCPPLHHAVVEHVTDNRQPLAIDLRDSSVDSSESGSEDDRSVSSAQRLLLIASSDHGRKSYVRQGKRTKLKRGPNPADDQSSGDEYSNYSNKPPSNTSGIPPFTPKTASDKKYLSLLQQTKESDTAFNPLQGKLQGNWGNRFGRIKNTFEKCATAINNSPKTNYAKTFWHDVCKCPSDDSIAYRSKKATSFKPVWTGEKSFSHALKSPFKPVVQKPIIVPPPVVEPPRPVHPPRHLPLYNSAVTTAHRPFLSVADKHADDGRHPWNPASPMSDLTSCPDSPSGDFDVPQPLVVSRVMGSPQTANIVKSKSSPRSIHPVAQQAPKPPTRSPRLVLQQRSPTSSPVRMPSVLQKSESWHQIIMGQTKAVRPHPEPVARNMAPYEGYLPKEQIARKQNIVRQHLRPPVENVKQPSVSPNLVKLNDDIDKVEDTFESLFKESTKAK